MRSTNKLKVIIIIILVYIATILTINGQRPAYPPHGLPNNPNGCPPNNPMCPKIPIDNEIWIMITLGGALGIIYLRKMKHNEKINDR